MSIVFNSYTFSEPEQLNHWNPPCVAGLYAILIPDETMAPKPFRVIYIGESGNISERGFENHHKRTSWLHHAGSDENLFVATLHTPEITEQERFDVESELIYHYDPVCND